MLVAGALVGDIADQLNLSAKTVSTHKTRIQENGAQEHRRAGALRASSTICSTAPHRGGNPGSPYLLTGTQVSPHSPRNLPTPGVPVSHPANQHPPIFAAGAAAQTASMIRAGATRVQGLHRRRLSAHPRAPDRNAGFDRRRQHGRQRRWRRRSGQGDSGGRPDTVILDMKLAQGSGLDVLRAVHRAAPEIEVWMLTNFAGEPWRKACRRLGAAQFFDKSTEFERVREGIALRAAECVAH